MPQLLIFAVVAGVALFAVRAVSREMNRVGDQLRRQDAKKDELAPMPLEEGSDGVYRPRDPQDQA